MKKIVLIFIFLGCLFSYSCQDEQFVQVTYYITDSNEGFTAKYVADPIDTTLTTEIVSGIDSSYEWEYTFQAERGDIYYIAVTDTTLNSFVRVMVRVDGKIINERRRSDEIWVPVITSGTIPF